MRESMNDRELSNDLRPEMWPGYWEASIDDIQALMNNKAWKEIYRFLQYRLYGVRDCLEGLTNAAVILGEDVSDDFLKGAAHEIRFLVSLPEELLEEAEFEASKGQESEASEE